MNAKRIDKTKRPRGRPWPDGKPYPEHINLALPAGTLARIERHLSSDETRVAWIREAIDDKLAAK